MSIQIALFQPDIPGNTGTILRLGACLGVPVHIIEPAGFDLSDRALKRAGMDYVEMAHLMRHQDWTCFKTAMAAEKRRIALLSTKAEKNYTDFSFEDSDVLMFGRESAGVPDNIHEASDHRLIIPMRQNVRSLNLAMSVAMVTGEALRQINQWHQPC